MIYFTHLQHLFEQLRTQKSKMTDTSLRVIQKNYHMQPPRGSLYRYNCPSPTNYQQIFFQFSLKWEEIDIFPAITVKYSSFKKDFGCQVMYVYLTPISYIRHVDFHTLGKTHICVHVIMLI